MLTCPLLAYRVAGTTSVCARRHPQVHRHRPPPTQVNTRKRQENFTTSIAAAEQPEYSIWHSAGESPSSQKSAHIGVSRAR
jgi:hypothetical protein